MSNGAKARRDTLKFFLSAWNNGTRSMQPGVRCPALQQFGSQSQLERFIKRILQRLPCLARNFAKQQRYVLIDMNREVGYTASSGSRSFSGPLVH